MLFIRIYGICSLYGIKNELDQTLELSTGYIYDHNLLGCEKRTASASIVAHWCIAISLQPYTYKINHLNSKQRQNSDWLNITLPHALKRGLNLAHSLKASLLFWCFCFLKKQQTSVDGSLTWLSSFSAASLRFGSMVPFRACMIRLGSIRPDAMD